MTLDEYTKEVFDYMVKKLSDVNQATLYEIAEFFVLKSNNFAFDRVAENNKQWLETMKRNDNFYIKLIEGYKQYGKKI